MEVTAQLVKELRQKTGVGMMACKKALTESKGDFEKATVYLREKGLVAASKKSDRETTQGSIFVSISDDKKVANLLEISCETDFVSSNNDFQTYGQQLVDAACQQNVETLENGRKEAGTYSINWDAGNNPSGMYFLRLEAGKETYFQKLMLIK